MLLLVYVFVSLHDFLYMDVEDSLSLLISSNADCVA